MNNDNSLATTSMMSTTSQFSSPIESTDISADWSKAEKLTFVPLPPNGRISSPSMSESIRLNLAKMPQQSTQQNNFQQPPPPLYQQQSPSKFMPQPSAQFNGNSFQNAQIPPQQYYHPGPQSQNYYEPQMPNGEYWPAQNNVQNAHQILPTQSQWMQNILAQNRGNGAAQNANGIGGMRTLWEQRIREENMEKHREELTKSRLSLGPKQFLFPRWRSVDAMTASLVASAKTTQMLPRDSRIPEYRQEKLAQTEQAAQINKFELHKPYIQMAIYKQHQRRGRSLLAEKPPYGAEEMARRRTMALYGVEGDQWYDPGQIRQAVSHESIANVGATRQMWEQTSWAEMAKGEFDREQERRQHFAQQRYWLPQ